MSITGYPNYVTVDYYNAVAQGLVPGASIVNVYGYQASVSTTVIPLWENATVYTYPASASTMRLWSSSASDTAVSILIQGLDSTYTSQSETLVLTNGTTGVITTNSYLRINSINVTNGTAPVGIIHLGNSGKTQTYAQINQVGSISAGRSQMSIYTVPAGYTFYLSRVSAYASPNASASKYMNYQVYSKNNVSGAVQFIAQAPFVDQYSTVRVYPRAYTQKTDIQWQFSSSSGTSAVGVGIEGLLVQGS